MNFLLSIISLSLSLFNVFLIEVMSPQGSQHSDSASSTNSKFDLFSINLAWVGTLKGRWDRVHPSLINIDKWWHSISPRLTFMSGAQIDGWRKWISASSLVSSFSFWLFEIPNKKSKWWGGTAAAETRASWWWLLSDTHLNSAIFLLNIHFYVFFLPIFHV